MGGKNAEREVSFNSGRTVCDHLDSSRYEVMPIFQTEGGDLFILPWKFLHRGKISDFIQKLESQAQKITWDDLKTNIDFAYIAQHGRFGEDGILQGTLDVLEIPYLGAKVFGSACGMDKAFQKKLFSRFGIRTPQGIVLSRNEISELSIDDVIAKLDAQGIFLPLIVKPSHEGSSLGVSFVENHEELAFAIKKALVSDTANSDVIIEERIVGMEFVCVSLQKSDGSWFSLPITEVVPEEGTTFYDYEQKYMPGRAKKITPARCSDKVLRKINDVCIKAAEILEFKTISRIDGFVREDGSIVIIDPNSLTGMGPATFLFHQAAQFGMSHTELINFLIDQELESYGLIDKILPTNKTLKDDGMNKKVRVGVLLGGDSNEREISLESGRNVCYKLSPHRYQVTPLFLCNQSEIYKLSPEQLIKNSTTIIKECVAQDQKIGWASLKEEFDFIFIGLHGGKGENGSIQGMLEMLGIPYNGPGVLASSLCMNKFKTNQFLAAQGFDVPQSKLINRTEWLSCSSSEQKKNLLKAICKQFNFPIVLKPYDDGCSVMIKKIHDAGELENELNAFFNSPKDAAMIEELVLGIELTGCVLGNDNPVALPPSQAIAKGGILSIQEKFLPGEGENQTPAPLPAEALDFVQETLKNVYQSIGCKGYSRIDCFYQEAKQSPTGQQRVVILEVNTLPGMTPATCIFHQAAEIGLKPMEFIDKIIELGFENHRNVKDNSLSNQNECLSNDKKLHVDNEKIDENVQLVEQPRPQAELRASVPEAMIIRMF